MPAEIHAEPAGGAVDLAECIARLDERGVDLAQPEGVAAAATLLARLSLDRTFLIDFALAELKDHCAGQQSANRYNAQVLLLHRAPGRHLLRANFWPGADDAILAASGRAQYFYDVPHDHNFAFLTLGYMGPGYGSRWYEQDVEQTAGYPGEPVALRLTEEGRLHAGRLLHYRAGQDVHDQLPPESLSVSINIIPETPGTVWRNQHIFDLDHGRVARMPTLSGSEILLRIAGTLGGGNGHDVAQHIARSHPLPRVRWHGWRALAAAAGCAQGRHAVMLEANSDLSPLVKALSAQQLALMERIVPVGG